MKKSELRQLIKEELGREYDESPEVKQAGSGVKIISHGLSNNGEISILPDHLPQLIKDLQSLHNKLSQ